MRTISGRMNHHLALLILLAPLLAASSADVGSGDIGSGDNSTDAEAGPSCKELPSWGAPVGIALGSFASVGINIGQNMQADGIATLPEELQAKPFKSRTWVIGETVFITCSIVNFAALALAPASVLVPLESIQFVTNVCYSRIVKKAMIPPKMLLGVALAVVGTVLTVVFGASGDSCKTLAQLEWAWTSAIWWIYLGITLSIAVVCLYIHKVYDKKTKAAKAANEEPPKHSDLILPITFTLSSALLGGSQMIVQSKVFSELLSMLLQGYFAMLTSWLIYVALVLVILCGMVWMIRLTQCLGMYNPLIILPLMVATYILFGGVAGGLYFREFDKLHENAMVGSAAWALYIGGLLCVIAGLYFIAVAGTAAEAASDEGGGSGAEPSMSVAKRATSMVEVEISMGGLGGAPGAPPPVQAPDDAPFDPKNAWRKLRSVVKAANAVKAAGLEAKPNGARMPAPPVPAPVVIGLAASNLAVGIGRGVSSSVSYAGRSSMSAIRRSTISSRPTDFSVSTPGGTPMGTPVQSPVVSGSGGGVMVAKPDPPALDTVSEPRDSNTSFERAKGESISGQL